MQAPTLLEVLRTFGDDNVCRKYLEALRWPDGVTCPRCDSAKISRVYDRNVFDCDGCRYQFSVLAGTVFQDTKLPLSTWFAATYLMCESRKGISANQVKRMIGGSYKTSWYLCHRIRAAMKEAGPLEKLDGVVEMDETFVGGRTRGKNWKRVANNKEVVIGFKQRDGELRFFHAEDTKSGTLAKYIKENISGDVEMIVTDSYSGYKYAVGDAKHKMVNHTADEYVRYEGTDCITTNGIESAFSLLKRGIVGSWHKVSAKHLSAYLDEMTFRFNNRNNPYLFRDTMMKLIEAPVLEYKNLTRAA
jgi:transposase-like protein